MNSICENCQKERRRKEEKEHTRSDFFTRQKKEKKKREKIKKKSIQIDSNWMENDYNHNHNHLWFLEKLIWWNFSFKVQLKSPFSVQAIIHWPNLTSSGRKTRRTGKEERTRIRTRRTRRTRSWKYPEVERKGREGRAKRKKWSLVLPGNLLCLPIQPLQPHTQDTHSSHRQKENMKRWKEQQHNFSRSHSEVQHADGVVRQARRQSISLTIPWHLKDAPSALVRPHQGPILDGPNVEPLIKGPRGQELPIGREGQRVNWLPVTRERVQALACLNVPDFHLGVKGGARQHQVCVWVCRARASGAPLYRVNLLWVLCQVVHTVLWVHLPKLSVTPKGGQN